MALHVKITPEKLVQGVSSFTYQDFARILNDFLEREVLVNVVRSLVEHSERFTGPFRPSTHREKLLQHVLQSREILFGDAIEEVFAGILEASGYSRLGRVLQVGTGSSIQQRLECDLFFKTPDGEKIVLVEQKLRDDHDSTKREGQISNFLQKIDFIRQNYSQPLYAVMHFVDPAFHKNKAFYETRLKDVADDKIHHIPLYGDELFKHLQNKLEAPPVVTWEDFEKWLRLWKQSRTGSFDEILNWDNKANIERLQNIAVEQPALFQKLAALKSKKRKMLWDEGWLQTLSPTGTAIISVVKVLEQSADGKALRAAKSLRKAMQEYKVIGGG